ncbi:MAG TPA: aromatic ring-hydroxylating dioxygenase subunit alpha, partial [Pseudomonadales bacterium]|nr:aromatic ring-hydroxylating dioxygenase subunit alpha [Pseudomonadales bacterium]
LTLVDQPIMVVRGRRDGEIRVMSRVCLHRAVPIIDGCGNRTHFTCPYHAWSYGTDGVLLRAPLMEGASAFVADECRLPQLRTELWNGFVMANLDPDAAPFAPQVAAFTDAFANFRLAEWQLVETLEYDTRLNWKVLVENFMEAYHHIAIHAKTFEPRFHAADSRVPDNDGPFSILHMPAAANAPAAEHALPQIDGLDADQQRDLYANVLFPCFLLGVQGDICAWYQVLPTAADRFTLRIHILVPPVTAALPELPMIREALAAAVDAIHQEDIVANDLVWAGLQAPLTRQGRLSPLEKSIWQINRWWLGEMGLGAAGDAHSNQNSIS